MANGFQRQQMRRIDHHQQTETIYPCLYHERTGNPT